MAKFRPGVTFSDFVVTDFAKSKIGKLDKPPRDFRKGVVVWSVCLMGLMFLFVRLLSLQVFGYQRYRVLADENRLRLVNLPAPRGVIYDRNGKILASNEDIFIRVQNLTVPSVKRVYPLNEAMAHVVGNLGEINGKELGLIANGGEYRSDDKIGRTGLEEFYENKLRGKDGGWLIEVDSQGKIVRDMGKTLPEAGKPLQTTLSADLTTAAWEALGEKKGAAVVSDPRNGEILALVSSPSFNPNRLEENFGQLNSDTNLPLFNRSIAGLYPPGSVFKMTVTTAAIDSGKVDPTYTVDDAGFIQVGTYRYNNWLFTKHGGIEGKIGFSRAITRSTDTFFYKIGELIGPVTMADYAKRLGFGQATGIDLNGEEKGVVPDPEWKKEMKGENWYLGNSFHFAIGQDDLLVTPLQVNQMTNILATGGEKCTPHLVNNAPSDPPLNLRGGRQRELCTDVKISQTALDIIKKGMVGACSPGGTAFPLFDWNQAALANLGNETYTHAATGSALPVIACKTGTAEYVAPDGRTRTHGWLTAYAPADNPTISVTVVMEGGGEGSNVAAPVVRKILAKYFNVVDKYPYANIPQEVGE